MKLRVGSTVTIELPAICVEYFRKILVVENASTQGEESLVVLIVDGSRRRSNRGACKLIVRRQAGYWIVHVEAMGDSRTSDTSQMTAATFGAGRSGIGGSRYCQLRQPG
jgi:hypothetical protein